MMAKGKFIVLEGIDGSGTTTQSKAAAEWLRRQGVDVVETHEPTKGCIGTIIRKALKRRMPECEGEELSPEFFALLFATDRMHHMKATVTPALESGQWVISDRCYLSSYAYQSIDYDLDRIRTLNQHAQRADLILLLDLDANMAYERIAPRGLYDASRLEVFETPDRMRKIRANYLRITELLVKEGERLLTLDASPPAEKVAEDVRAALSELV